MQTKWKIEGNVLLHSQFEDIRLRYGDKANDLNVALKNLPVKISAREKILGAWGPWNSWGEVKTNGSGFFSLVNEKDQSKRQFKIEVFFKNDDFIVYPENTSVLSALAVGISSLLGAGGIVAEQGLEQLLEQTSRLTFDVDWFTVYQSDGDGREAGTHSFPGLIFKSGQKEDLGDTVARSHADIWHLYYKVKDYLAGLPGSVGFISGKRIAIKYPHKNMYIGNDMEAPYTSPANDVIFIVKNSVRDWFDIDTLLHELMHLWSYQHCTGEMGLAWQLIAHRSTHDGLQEKSFTAFQEGFAEWSSNRIYHDLFTLSASAEKNSKIYGGLVDDGLPFNRQILRERQVDTVSEAGRNEFAWISLFNMLCTPELYAYNLIRKDTVDPITKETKSDIHADKVFTPAASETCSSPVAKLADILQVFKANAAKGFPKLLDKDEMNIDSFLKRVCGIVSGFSSEDVEKYKILIATDRSEQPHDVFCKPKLKKADTKIKSGFHP